MDNITCDCTYCRRRTNACFNRQTSRGRYERSNTAPASSHFSTSSVMDFVSTMTGDAFKRKDRVRRESVVEGGGEERQLRTALLNGFGQFFIVILVYVGYQVYQLLDSFLRPSYWALVIGIVLFPFKTALARWAKNWVNHLKATDTPLAVGILRVPLELTDTALEHVGGVVVRIVKENTALILWAGLFYSLGGLFNFMFYVFNIDVIAAMYLALGLLMTIAASNLVWVIVLTHVFALIFYWNSETEKEIIIKMATPVYLALAIHLTAWFGIIAAPLVLFCGAVLVIGLTAEVRTLMQRFQHHKTQALHQEKIAEWGRFAALSPWNFSWWPVLLKVQTHVAEGRLAVDLHSSRADLDVMTAAGDTTDPAEFITEAEDAEPESTHYLRILWRVFVVVQLLKSPGLIPLVLFPTAYTYIKHAIPQSTYYQTIVEWVRQMYDKVKDELGDRSEALVPKPLIGLYKMATYGDRKILTILGNTIDEAAANLMICLMFLFFIFAGGFVLVQVQQETAYMVRMSGEFVDRSISEHPELLKWMPEGGIQDNLRQSVDSLYFYARDFVSDTVKKMMGDEKSNNTEQISNEILFMMDRLYNTYLAQSKSNDTLEGSLALGENTQAIQLIPDQSLMEKARTMFSWSFVTDYAYAHFETIYSVADTIITLVKDNAALIASMATSVLSFVIAYFSQFVDFILNTVFFLASLSLLLSLSDDQYYPLYKLSKLTDYFPEVGNIADVVELSINGIFNASFKMALFYGGYTYTLLSVFDVYVTFIPSVVASIFAVIPLFPTYIVILPALAELLFVRQDYFLASLMAIGAYYPTTCVDEVMYQEVKTAHPYLFGLAVAGGLMTFGIEGVVVGPVLLCAFVIFVELSRTILKPSELPPANSSVTTSVH